jgi:hypothetical protein
MGHTLSELPFRLISRRQWIGRTASTSATNASTRGQRGPWEGMTASAGIDRQSEPRREPAADFARFSPRWRKPSCRRRFELSQGRVGMVAPVNRDPCSTLLPIGDQAPHVEESSPCCPGALLLLDADRVADQRAEISASRRKTQLCQWLSGFGLNRIAFGRALPPPPPPPQIFESEKRPMRFKYVRRDISNRMA